MKNILIVFTRRAQRARREAVMLAGALAGALLLIECAPQGVAPPPQVTLGVQKASSSPLREIFSALSNGPGSVASFDCYAVNVTGYQVSSNIALTSDDCTSSDNMQGNGFGTLSASFASNSTVDVTVPSGTPLNFSIYGLYPSPSSCGGSGTEITGYFLGSVSQTIQANTSITVPISYSGDSSDLSCGGTELELMGGSLQGEALDLAGAVTTFAGARPSSGSSDGTGTTARFANPQGVATDGTNLYVADTANNIIRQIVISTGVVTTLAGEAGPSSWVDGTGSAARFSLPMGITYVGGNLYVADASSSTIRQIVVATGVVTTFAGIGNTAGSANGTGTSASFTNPQGITTDGTNLYVADSGNDTIRQIVIATAAVTTIAGSAGSASFYDNTTGTAALFHTPEGITYDAGGGTLYVADSGNNAIRQITLGGINPVVTIAGGGTSFAGTSGDTNNTTGTSALFHTPYGITNDGTYLYVADSANNNVRQITMSGLYPVATLAGSVSGFGGSADGTSTAASFNGPAGIVAQGSDVYVTDENNNTIRQIVTGSGVVTTYAGNAVTLGATDGTGQAALFESPNGITTDGDNLYVADSLNNTIRQIVISTGVVTTIAGTAGASGTTTNVTGTAARFWNPTGITTDGTNLYVADTDNDTIRQIVIATGYTTTLAGAAGSSGSTTNVAGTAAKFWSPTGITTDGTNVYVADKGNNSIRQIVIATGFVTTIAGTGSQGSTTNVPGSSASFYSPQGITTDGTNLYVADTGNSTIRQIALGSSYYTTTLAGTAGITGATNATGSSASFSGLVGITTDGTSLFVADANNDLIRQVDIATGAATTLAGMADSTGDTDATGTSASFDLPLGITTDGSSVYVIDTDNNTVRQIQ